MSYVKIWVHLVFTTKNRESFLNRNSRLKVFEHIQENSKNKEIFIQAINGYIEHVHCLISLGKDQSIAQVAQLIKGESSYWINTNKILPFKFMWQDDYYAVSVSESQVKSVISYINNQETHHKTKTYSEEVEEFIIKYGFQHLR